MKNILRSKTYLILSIITMISIIGLAGCGDDGTSSIYTAATATPTPTTGELTVYNFRLAATGQVYSYDNVEIISTELVSGYAFYGQDGYYQKGTPMSYTDNGDGTVTDNVTGLMWGQDQSEYNMPWDEAGTYCSNLTLGGYDDWRLPTLKELWSIRDFSAGWPFVNTNYFNFVGDGTEGRYQHTWSSNEYLVDTPEAVKNNVFATNDWTGHIKCFDGARPVRPVRGDTYGINEFVDNGNGIITDNATGLMWTQDDSGTAMNWEDALSYADSFSYAGYDDWRLPNVKELQSIVDYSGVFPAIDSSKFNTTGITNEAGNDDYPYYWTITTNPYIDPREGDPAGYCFAWYVAFGYAVDASGQDMHGAGAVRFDTKWEGGADGPDGERFYNFIRLVRDAE